MGDKRLDPGGRARQGPAPYSIGVARLVLYDDRCGLCSGAAAWLARRDRDGALAFSPIDSPEGLPYRAQAFPSGDAGRPDTLVVVEREEGREVVTVRAEAVASALRALGPPWSLAGVALSLAPRRLADAVYRAVARSRPGSRPTPG